jgi:radical SAM superfamily enzyme YgiQ (UPF0313 family)
MQNLKGTSIVFINMPLREAATPNVPPQGPLLLSARLREHGANVTIIDLNAYRIKDDIANAKNLPNGRHLSKNEAKALIACHFEKYGEPDMIAMSGMITTLRWQSFISVICRGLVHNSFIVSGGGLATEIGGNLFHWMLELDGIVRSEGDNIILELASDILRSKIKNTNVSSKHYFGKINGRQRFVYEGDRPKDLDVLPLPALDLLEADVYGNNILEQYINTPVWGGDAGNSSAAPFTMKRSLTTVSSRGCPYACAFCYRGAQGERNYGMRSSKSIVCEAKMLIEKYNIDFLGYPDDNFAVDKNRISQLADTLGELKLRWGTHTRMDEADDRVFNMAKAGCIYIGFGAESASPSVLESMKKGGFILKRGITKINGFEFPTTMVNAIKNCIDAGIHANCTWIMGYPGETLDDLKTSVAFILWQQSMNVKDLIPGTVKYDIALKSVNTKMFTATAYPGTAMFKESIIKNALKKHFNVDFNANTPVFNDALKTYILNLDDATKVMNGINGSALYFGSMSEDMFLKAREFVDADNIEGILSI